MSFFGIKLNTLIKGLVIQKEIGHKLREGCTPSSTYKKEMTLCQQNETPGVSEL